MQDCSISSALAMGTLQFCTKPSTLPTSIRLFTCFHLLKYQITFSLASREIEIGTALVALLFIPCSENYLDYIERWKRSTCNLAIIIILSLLTTWAQTNTHFIIQSHDANMAWKSIHTSIISSYIALHSCTIDGSYVSKTWSPKHAINSSVCASHRW